MRTILPGSPGRRALVVAGFALAFCLGLQGVEPLFFLRDDNSTYYLPAYVYNHLALAETGRLAEVNPHQLLGTPHLATGQSAVLYPPVYGAVQSARWLGDLRWTLDLLAALHLAAAAVGMFFLLRRLGLGRSGGDAAGALLWVTTPFVVVLSRAWIPFAYAAAFVPWSFLLLLRLLDRPTWGRALAYGSLKTLFFFAGYPQTWLYATFLEAVFFVVLRALDLGLGTVRRRRVAGEATKLVGAAVWTAATSAPLLLPMVDAVRRSFMRRERLPLEVFGEFPMAIGDFLAAQVFLFRDEVFLTAGSSIFFVGPLFLAAFLAALPAAFPTALPAGVPGLRAASERGEEARGAGPERRALLVLAALAGLALLASTSAWTRLYGLPLISSFRWPAKNFFFFVFGAVPAVAWTYERLFRARPRAALAALVLSLAGSVGLLGLPDARRSMGEATLAHPVEHYERHLAEACPEPGRIAALRVDGTLDAERWDELAPYLAAYNYATLFGRHQIGGYEPMVSEMHYRLSAGMNYTATLPLRRATPEVLRHLGSWGVTCVLVPDLPGVDAALADRAGVSRLGLSRLGVKNGIAAYRLDGAPVAAWKGPRGDVEGAVPFRWTASGLELDRVGGGGEEGLLRIAVAPMPRWSVELRGGSDPGSEWSDVAPTTRLDPAAGLFVELPEGGVDLRLTYRDPLFAAGLWVALLAVAVVGLGLVFRRRMPRCGD